jgi:hypothetical protein
MLREAIRSSPSIDIAALDRLQTNIFRKVFGASSCGRVLMPLPEHQHATMSVVEGGPDVGPTGRDFRF